MEKCVRCKNKDKTQVKYNSIPTSSICMYYLPENLCDECIEATRIKKRYFKQELKKYSQ